MKHKDISFYDNWAKQQLKDDNRISILEWKAHNIYNLIQKANINIKSVLEVGCAEGVLLNYLQNKMPAIQFYGIDISEVFINIAKSNYPLIIFQPISHTLFFKTQDVDLVILSDITEHVEDDDLFIQQIIPYTKYIAFKFPIELCYLTESNILNFLRRLLGRESKKQSYGVHHINRHLRGYTSKTARRCLKRNNLEIMTDRIATVSQFYGNNFIANVLEKLNLKLAVAYRGGAYFALAKKNFK